MTERFSFRFDDYTNNVTALGTQKDKSRYTGFVDGGDLGEAELDGLYEKNALGSRVVDRVVDDAIRVPFKLTGTDKEFDWEQFKSELDDIDALNRLGDAWRWARLYGGSIAVMNINDATDLGKRLQIDKAREVRSIEIIESRYARPQIFTKKLGVAGFRNPEIYDVTTPLGRVGKVHRSRVIRFDGVRIPPTRLLSRGGWGPSVLDKVWEDLKRLGSAMGYSESILHEISLMLLSIDGYREAMAGDENDRSTLQRVFEKMKWGIDALNILVLDSKDEFREQTRTVTGISQLIEQFIAAMVRATDMPRTILLGEQPGGLNASADTEIRAWYDHVANQQEKVLNPALNRLITIMFAIKQRRGERVPTEWVIEWDPLWQPTEKEQADTTFMRAQAAVLQQTQLGVVAPDETRKKMINDGDIEPIEGAMPMLDVGLS